MIILRSTAVILLLAGLSLAYPQEAEEDVSLTESPVAEYETMVESDPNYEEVSPSEHDTAPEDDQALPSEPPSVYEYDDATNLEAGVDYEEEEVDYNELPEFLSEPQSVPVEEGGTAELPCVINKATPHLMIIKKLAEDEKGHEPLYFVGDMKLKHDSRISINNGVMKVKNIKMDDAGDYSCYYESDPIVEVRHTIDVQYPPTMLEHSEDQRVVKGDSVTLNCSATGNPEPKLLWSRVNGRLPSGAHEEEMLSMILEDVDRHVEGTYTCKADNGIGSPATAEVHVAVEYEPEIITEKAIVTHTEGTSMEIVCIVYSRPIAQVTWDINGGTIEMDPNVEEMDGGHRHAIAVPLDQQDYYGEYTCFAENIHGNASASEAFSEEPTAPEIESDPEGDDETSFTLKWSSDSYTPITEYNITYYNLNEEIDQESNETGIVELGPFSPTEAKTHGITHTMHHILLDLEPGTEYDVSVQVSNQFMYGETTSFTFTTKSLTTTTTTTTTTSTTTAPTTVKLETIAPTAHSAKVSHSNQGKKKTNGSSIPSISVFLLLASTLLLQA